MPKAVAVSRKRSNVRPKFIHSSIVLWCVANSTRCDEELILVLSVLFCVLALMAVDIKALAINFGRLGAPKVA